LNENVRDDFRREFVDEVIMIFVHGCTKSAAPDEYLFDPDFEFVHLFFQFDIFGTSGARITIQNNASLRSVNLYVGSTAQSCQHFVIRVVLWIKSKKTYIDFSDFIYSSNALRTVGLA
jgi:hypothetical protein